MFHIQIYHQIAAPNQSQFGFPRIVISLKFARFSATESEMDEKAVNGNLADGVRSRFLRTENPFTRSRSFKQQGDSPPLVEAPF